GGKGGKRRQGDNKTPVGVYRVMNFKKDSKFHFFMQLDYPNPTDGWYGYKDKIINAYDFREIAAAYKNREVPPQDTPLGGYIGIHGLGDMTKKKLKIHNEFNWTEGCIALRNDEISELRNYVTIGTRIIIRE
ncbi:MAG: murein L,D-transpeptidase, partial [Gammaproteobacteria bacterium]|nr:murein L,D-transpeptidase [Gammaproteobacteria bacterium]NIR94829.1 murein L,D-transpeptidase [Gammaproteobacteria bacterium]NIW43944.1 L,D-transpeptidase family protein [Gammaproteobacteria bacterium]NIX55051.1 L,D-transpeptidase family protein [candidate division Zixibacteria bacterium]